MTELQLRGVRRRKGLLTQQFGSLDPTLNPSQIAAKIADYEASRTPSTGR